MVTSHCRLKSCEVYPLGSAFQLARAEGSIQHLQALRNLLVVKRLSIAEEASITQSATRGNRQNRRLRGFRDGSPGWILRPRSLEDPPFNEKKNERQEGYYRPDRLIAGQDFVGRSDGLLVEFDRADGRQRRLRRAQQVGGN